MSSRFVRLCVPRGRFVSSGHAEHTDDGSDPSLGVVGEGHHAELDHLVAAMVKAGRLDVDHERDAFARPRSVGGVNGAWLQPPQHAVVVVLLEDLRRAFRIERVRQAPAPRRSRTGPRLPERGTVVLVGIIEQVGLGEW